MTVAGMYWPSHNVTNNSGKSTYNDKTRDVDGLIYESEDHEH